MFFQDENYFIKYCTQQGSATKLKYLIKTSIKCTQLLVYESITQVNDPDV